MMMMMMMCSSGLQGDHNRSQRPYWRANWDLQEQEGGLVCRSGSDEDSQFSQVSASDSCLVTLRHYNRARRQHQGCFLNKWMMGLVMNCILERGKSHLPSGEIELLVHLLVATLTIHTGVRKRISLKLNSSLHYFWILLCNMFITQGLYWTKWQYLLVNILTWF